MTARSLVSAGLCAVLVPLVSAVSPLLDLPGASSLWTIVDATVLTAPVTPHSTLHPQHSPVPADVPVKSERLEARSAASGLTQATDAVARADRGPAWLAWRVEAVAGRGGNGQRWNDGSDHGRCVLDDDGDIVGGYSNVPGETRQLVVLARLEAGAITRVTFTDNRCTVDAGRRPVYWFSDVAAAQSVDWLAERVRRWAQDSAGDRDRPGKQALAALALHADASAERALTGFVAGSQPRELRKNSAFWLGAARGASAIPLLARLAREDRDDTFREHLTFVLTLPGDAGIDTLLELARRDPSAEVRGQALFWLGQKAGARAAAALESAVSDDPDRDVRKKAVFAISQLPKDEGVPKLIALARTHRDPGVRKQAMFWLGQSGDPRAVAFFEEVLTK
jgi:hypothetical protein